MEELAQYIHSMSFITQLYNYSVEGQPPHKDEEERQQSQEDNLSGEP